MTKKVPLCNCIQFHTDDDAICAVKRSWLRDFAHDFITRCHDNGIGVVNLAPIPGINTNNLLDFRQFKVAELFTFISRFDLTISIDSRCFRHSKYCYSGKSVVGILSKTYVHEYMSKQQNS